MERAHVSENHAPRLTWLSLQQLMFWHNPERGARHTGRKILQLRFEAAPTELGATALSTLTTPVSAVSINGQWFIRASDAVADVLRAGIEADPREIPYNEFSKRCMTMLPTAFPELDSTNKAHD